MNQAVELKDINSKSDKYLTSHQKRINWVLSLVGESSVARSKFKNCLRDSAQHHIYQYLIGIGVDVESEIQRKAATVVLNACVVTKQTPSLDGIHFAKALRQAVGEGSDLRFQKIINARNAIEFADAISRVIRFVESRVGSPINFAQLWQDILSFDSRSEKIKVIWANQFYTKSDLDSMSEERKEKDCA